MSKSTKENRIFVFIDLANAFHWQEVLRWNFSIEALIKQLKKDKQVVEVRVYYGEDTKNTDKSRAIFKKVVNYGGIVVSKPVKYIRKTIDTRLFVKERTLGLFSANAQRKLKDFVNSIKDQKILYIEEPKANFDVEMSLDMLEYSNRYDTAYLFSGDSDFKAVIERIKKKGKSVCVFGVRGMVASEIWSVMDSYNDFGKWYKGPRKRKSRQMAGPRER